MGRSNLQTAKVEGGAGLAELTLHEAYREIINACFQSTVVTGIEHLLLEEPVLKLRVHLGNLACVDVFYNEETGKTSFALIKGEKRIFAVDNTRGWHSHPFDNPESHHPCEQMSFESFLMQVEKNKEKWE